MSGNQIIEGASLRLDDILQTSLFRLDISPHYAKTIFGLTEPNAAFPLLSYGDHPVLGMPCWCFHPCETSKAVDELVKEMGQDGRSEDENLLQWMRAWFLVLRNTVNIDC
jgi:ubiquitin-like-conjugating enzyme ATG10